MSEETLETFWSFIDAADLCVMTARDTGSLRARPMMAKVDKATHEFRFLTRLSSHKTDELAASPDVNIAFCDPGKGHVVSVSGQAYLTQDRTLIDRLWTPQSTAYFGCGKDDPDIAVIRVVPAEAECWDSRGALQQSWNIFKAKHAEGEPDRGAHRKHALG